MRGRVLLGARAREQPESKKRCWSSAARLFSIRLVQICRNNSAIRPARRSAEPAPSHSRRRHGYLWPEDVEAPKHTDCWIALADQGATQHLGVARLKGPDAKVRCRSVLSAAALPTGNCVGPVCFVPAVNPGRRGHALSIGRGQVLYYGSRPSAASMTKGASGLDCDKRFIRLSNR